MSLAHHMSASPLNLLIHTYMHAELHQRLIKSKEPSRKYQSINSPFQTWRKVFVELNILTANLQVDQFEELW